MREKLIELISEYHEAWKHGEGDWKAGLADYLLANRGIVLPCGKGTKLNYDGIDYEVDHWNILASAFNDKVREEGKSRLHLFDIEEAYKALKGVE